MQNNTIIIGEGDKRNTAIVVFNIKDDKKHNISHNDTSYWIHHLLFDMEMVIFKDTVIGQTLTSLIDNKYSMKEITKYLNNIVLKHVSVEQVENTIEKIKKEQFDKGKLDAKQEIRNALGIYNNTDRFSESSFSNLPF